MYCTVTNVRVEDICYMRSFLIVEYFPKIPDYIETTVLWTQIFYIRRCTNSNLAYNV
jgi:hypothetical protein